jgi:DNA-binding HxlR family transcriptional regulator
MRTVSEPTGVVHALHPPEEPSEWEMVDGTRLVVGLLSGRWSVGVLYLLADGTKRFSELFYEVGEVSKKALTHTLRALERDGLVERRAYAEVPARVEYSLTSLGWSMTGVLMGMYEWAAQHEPQVATARRRAAGPVAEAPTLAPLRSIAA